ncbi:c-type cytochrome [bacterium]|nr:c-type cytochrome [bacterium]MBU1991056.1 c-type cytochrome [bacterium]
MKKIALTLLIASVGLMAADGAALFKKCASCHGANGEKKALNQSQVIAGWDAAKTEASLKGYKDGSYGGKMKGLMKGQVAAYSDADITAVSAYIAGLK